MNAYILQIQSLGLIPCSAGVIHNPNKYDTKSNEQPLQQLLNDNATESQLT